MNRILEREGLGGRINWSLVDEVLRQRRGWAVDVTIESLSAPSVGAGTGRFLGLIDTPTQHSRQIAISPKPRSVEYSSIGAWQCGQCGGGIFRSASISEHCNVRKATSTVRNAL
jgi:hypothetical protein